MLRLFQKQKQLLHEVIYIDSSTIDLHTICVEDFKTLLYEMVLTIQKYRNASWSTGQVIDVLVWFVENVDDVNADLRWGVSRHSFRR